MLSLGGRQEAPKINQQVKLLKPKRPSPVLLLKKPDPKAAFRQSDVTFEAQRLPLPAHLETISVRSVLSGDIKPKSARDGCSCRLGQKMKKHIVAGLCAAALLCAPQASFADSKADWDKLSTALSLGLVGGAAAYSFEQSDKPGLMEFAKGMGSTILLTHALKTLVHERRPDGSDNASFPSGHTSAAMAAATFLSIRYKDQLGGYAPLLFGAAALTGVARVKADRHYAKDVIAGAALGAGMAYLFTSQVGKDMSVYPTADGVGATYDIKF